MRLEIRGFFSARREIMGRSHDLSAENTGLHSTVGRHFAGITVRG